MSGDNWDESEACALREDLREAKAQIATLEARLVTEEQVCVDLSNRGLELAAEVEAAEQKVKELEDGWPRCCGQCDEANERARIREGMERLTRWGERTRGYDTVFIRMEDGEYVDRDDALALVEKPEEPR